LIDRRQKQHRHATFRRYADLVEWIARVTG
jgi:hypothetical protein